MSHRISTSTTSKLVALSVVAAMAATAAGCQKDNNAYPNGTAPAASATTPMTVPNATNPPMTTAPGMASTAAAATMGGSMTDSFVAKAATGGMEEVKLAKLALSKTSNAEVKDFANKMVADHTDANNKLQSIASDVAVTIPTMMTAQQKAKMSELQSKSGAAFDKAYADTMVQAHQMAIATFQDGARGASTEQLRQFASSTLPTLKDHLQMAQDLQAKVANENTSQ